MPFRIPKVALTQVCLPSRVEKLVPGKAGRHDLVQNSIHRLLRFMSMLLCGRANRLGDVGLVVTNTDSDKLRQE